MVKALLKKIRLIEAANAAVKGVLQERKANAALEQYRRTAREKGIEAPAGGALRQALAKRIAERRRGRAAKRMGEMHIFLAYYVSNWEAVLPMALAPFGQLTAFEWRSRGFNDNAPDWLEKRDAMNRAMLEAFHAANRERPVDAVVGYLSGANTSPQTLQEMARAGAVIFNFCWDDKLWFPGFMLGGRLNGPAAIAHAVDLNLTNAPDSVIKYAVEGGLAMFWPEAAHPDVHKPYDTPFDFDVSFVGACYGWRPKFIGRLRKMGVKVECFGRGWPNGPISDQEMVRLYSRSRINLGFAGVGHSRRLMCLKGRDFEVPMSGGLYLTQDNPELTLVFDIGREIVTYRDEADCAAKIKALLADPEKAAAIRKAGRERSLREHTYVARWKQAFELAGLLE
jgi:spore maturation protein CgeB